MKQLISAETLFEDFVEQIETAVDAVATQVPYTRQQIVSISFTMVDNAGIYYDGVKEWRQKDTAEESWEAFKMFFAREFREIRVQPRTSAAEGYGTNNMRGGHANAAEIYIYNSNRRKRLRIWPQQRQQTDRQWQSFPLATQH